MIPLLEAELVRAHHWLTPRAFADAMALGQITPGPVVISSAFVGYSVAGLSGAILATGAVFLPALLMTLVVGTSVDRFRRSPALQAFLAGIQPAVVGLMIAAAWALGQHGIRQWPGVAIALLAFLLIWRGHISPFRILLGSAAIGVVWALVRP
jgi:chromate transporter